MKAFIQGLMLKVILTCKEVTDHAVIGDEEHLPWGKKLRFKIHLALCRVCRHYHQLMKRMGQQEREMYQKYLKDHRSEIELTEEKIKKEKF